MPLEEAEPSPELTMLARFLRAVTDGEYEEAEALSETILKLEPGNKIILEYQRVLPRPHRHGQAARATRGPLAERLLAAAHSWRSTAEKRLCSLQRVASEPLSTEVSSNTTTTVLSARAQAAPC